MTASKSPCFEHAPSSAASAHISFIKATRSPQLGRRWPGAFLIAGAIIHHRRQWKINADESDGDGFTFNPSDEALKEEWELNYIGQVRMAEREADLVK
jgi:hypothetical protein